MSIQEEQLAEIPIQYEGGPSVQEGADFSHSEEVIAAALTSKQMEKSADLVMASQFDFISPNILSLIIA
jgi:hypothetical protein